MPTNAKKFLKSFFLMTLILLLIAVVAVGIYCYTIYRSALDMSLESFDANLTTIIYATDPKTGEENEVEYLYADENRIWVPLEEIPQDLQDAFVAIEDERFWSHPGVDFKRTFLAAVNTVIRYRDTFGGSTITQQLIKNVTQERETKISRKVTEIFRALALEKNYDKTVILEYYLNTIYLSQRCNGVTTAARVYFDKELSELTLAECASIAGITQYPSLYDPFLNPEANKQKQEIVLAKMYENELITKEEMDAAIAEELQFSTDRTPVTSSRSYFADQLFNDVLNDLQDEAGYTATMAEKLLYNGGLRIYSTIDPNIQSIAEEYYENAENFPKSSDEENPYQSAMTVIDNETGAIVAIIGGLGEKEGNRVLNRATQTVRQPGSSIKPLAVYAPALEYGTITSSSIVSDTPVTIGGWSPRNSYSGFLGDIPVSVAVAKSSNLAAVNLCQTLGVENSFNFLKNKLGFTSLVERRVESNGDISSDINLSSLALGGMTDGVTVTEMAAAYASFANEGVYTVPYTYTKVYDSNGKLLLEKRPKSNVAMSETTAYLMTNLLKGVVSGGTGSGAGFYSWEVAGKTGTTDSRKDRWFAGYTPLYTAVVWFGNDEPAPLPSSLGNPCITIFRNVMGKAHSNLSPVSFKRPNGLISVETCSVSGYLATDACRNDPEGTKAVSTYFSKNNVPEETCPLNHQLAPIEPEVPEAELPVTPEPSIPPAPITPTLPSEEDNGLR